jgi:50S ribosomal protein L16 3-hydroxylase
MQRMASIAIDRPAALLGGLSPSQFMRRHWQKKPLLVRQALPGVQPPLGRAALFELAGHGGIESRLVVNDGRAWTLRHGPLPRCALPPLRQPGWTLLVQGVDLHVAAAHELLARFRFVPAARLDDVMVSYASDRGGVGPHVDSYDVFLVQVAGRRRWRVGRNNNPALREGVPLKILRRFVPEHDWLLEPGDLLYLPPGWAHDGEAAGGDCMTCSIGFRAPSGGEFARELLGRLADEELPEPTATYRDPGQPATAAPGEVPRALREFAADSIRRRLADADAVDRALGEVLTEPRATVFFDRGEAIPPGSGVVLDRRSRMMYDSRHVYFNGESFRAAGRDARVMRRLADALAIDAAAVAQLSAPARRLLDEWAEAGWLHADGRGDAGARRQR